MKNQLAGALSPYLAQHATDPVHWWPWGEEAFAHARATDRLVLISSGYSSCHWCHVMQAESFRDPELAAVMNAHYVCIKVDREERPDVDHVYMDALQLMTGTGGWPLNCFALPDGRPVYAGTYFRPDRWHQLLLDLQALWHNERDRVLAQADALHDGLLRLAEPVTGDHPDLATWVDAALAGADPENGGISGAPKFAMPAFQGFLLNEYRSTGNEALRAHLLRTLDAMISGALLDHADGGFARYTVDAAWQLPHFERMLYDNAQLIGLYAEAFTAFNDPLYQRTAERAIACMQEDLGTEEGDFFSATDAVTSEGEGAFQAWTLADIERLPVELRATFDRWYALSEPHAAIEERRLLIHQELPRIATDLAACDTLCDTLNDLRLLRPAPAKDTKRLTAWNALMVSALCKAGDRFGRAEYHADAQRTLEVLLAHHRRNDGGLWHDRRPATEGILGFLDDHAFTLRALIDLFASTGAQRWLTEAVQLETWISTHFGIEDLLPFAVPGANALVAPTVEVRDGVMPSSNALLADARFDLALLLQDQTLADKAEAALRAALPRVATDPVGHGQWGRLLRKTQGPWYRISVGGPEADAQRRSLAAMGLPGILYSGDNTGIQICTLQACLAPFPHPEAVRAHCA